MEHFRKSFSFELLNHHTSFVSPLYFIKKNCKNLDTTFVRCFFLQ
uniref:Uncharacterized protein n=1 Tax=Anguilla anguilla TaxID=7936 RepID=A0A0E9PHE4_ANGAN